MITAGGVIKEARADGAAGCGVGRRWPNGGRPGVIVGRGGGESGEDEGVVSEDEPGTGGGERVGGAAVAVGDAAGWAPDVGIGVAWAIAATVAAIGIAVARRLPGPAPAAPATPRPVDPHAPLAEPPASHGASEAAEAAG